MQARILRRLVAAASLAATVPLAVAEAPDSCGALPGAGEDPLARRAEILAQYRQLPAACLQDIFADLGRLADSAWNSIARIRSAAHATRVWIRTGSRSRTTTATAPGANRTTA